MTGNGAGGFRQYLGLREEATGDGRAVLSLEADERHLNPNGTVHGGVLAALADAAMGTAVATVTDGRPVTIEMKVTFLEPGRPGRLVARANTRKPGRRITIVEAEVTAPKTRSREASPDEPGEDDEVVAHAIATFTTLE